MVVDKDKTVTLDVSRRSLDTPHGRTSKKGVAGGRVSRMVAARDSYRGNILNRSFSKGLNKLAENSRQGSRDMSQDEIGSASKFAGESMRKKVVFSSTSSIKSKKPEIQNCST